jgi:hypothetical protein
MVRLSNVVGGIMRDLARSHSVSDAYTVDTLESYRQDPMLGQFPVPRMAIREVQLTLRFAVSDIQDPVVEEDPGAVRELWLRAVQERILPLSLAEVGRADNRTVVAAFAKRLAAPGTELTVEAGDVLAADRADALAKATLAFLNEQASTLPLTARRSIEKTELGAAFERIVAQELPELQRAARQLEQARIAKQSELDVLVTSEALGSVPDNRISELTVTVAMDDVQFGAQDGQG